MFRSRPSLQPRVSRCARGGGSTESASRYPRLRTRLVPGRTGLYTCLHRGSVVIVNDKRPQVATPNVVAGSPDFGANTPCILLTCIGVTIQLKAGQSKPSWLGTSVINGVRAMFHSTIPHDDFQRISALQHYCDIVSNCFNIVSTLLPQESSWEIIVSCKMGLSLLLVF